MIKMIFRKYLFIIIAVLLLPIGLLLYKVETIVPSTMKFADFGGANTFYFYESDIYYKNQALLQRYFELNKDKIVKRISIKEADSANKTIRFAYNSDKGRDLFVDDKGRIFFVVSKPEIRNKSRLHWLWWKLDVFDNYNYIYYCTDPDSGIEQLVNLIKNDIGTNS